VNKFSHEINGTVILVICNWHFLSHQTTGFAISRECLRGLFISPHQVAKNIYEREILSGEFGGE
jgi:hypothetical protein